MKRKYNLFLSLSIMFIAIFLTPMKAQADPDPRLWHWIDSNDKVGFFVSTRMPIRYKDGIKQWVMKVYADGSYDIESEGFRWNNGKEYAILHFTKYNSDGKVIDSVDAPLVMWRLAIPGSFGEEIWDYVTSQARRM